MSTETLLPHLPQTTSDTITWPRFDNSALALALFQAAKEYSGPLLVIAPDNHTVAWLADEITFFSEGTLPVLVFPDWETLPYDRFSPHQDIISARLRTLQQLGQLTRGIVIASITTLMHRLAPSEFLAGFTVQFKAGDKIDPDTLRHRLQKAGYHCVTQVTTHGEYTLRGSIIDLYPMGYEWPIRLDLFDNEIESIRLFDPDTQLSTEKIQAIELLPAHEFPLTESGIGLFRQQWRERFAGNPAQHTTYQDVSQGQAPAGIEYYLPLFFEKTAVIKDYLPINTCIVRLPEINEAAEKFWDEIKERHEQCAYDIYQPLLPINDVFIARPELFADFRHFAQITLQEEAHPDIRPLPELTISHKMADPLLHLKQFRSDFTGKILLVAESAGRREALIELLRLAPMSPTPISHWSQFLNQTDTLCITEGLLHQGFILESANIAVIAEGQLHGEQVLQRRKHKSRSIDSDWVVKNLTELRPNAPVVHSQHGVGRFQGLTTIEVNGINTEFLCLLYANDDKLYVPVTSLHLINRYTGGDEDHAPLHRLGNDRWLKETRKAQEQIRDVAAELLAEHARRAAQIGYAFPKPDLSYEQFAAKFPFELTVDQEQAIHQVIENMTSTKMMDRLICGDVGFGKTEVAMRAVFMAVHGKKQVAVLVPTTLLAQQHFETFQDRFADIAVKIELLSRFRSAAEQAKAIAGIASGAVDIVIGTHKLLQEQIKFADLGLLVIDEEHRFGVRQKEQLKKLRANVDMLSLTATPIPRTLNMAMAGMRDISIIATPPARRLAIKTFVQERNKPLMREAIMREILRGGQVYFLHNTVSTMPRIATELQELVPEARLEMAHGQLPERQLERIMSDFYHQRFNVLVCSTIIETGIDIPTANTIIIDRADCFGLAQLHQLRGRVGRSSHQAYAYLMIPDQKTLTEEARQRLDAIATLEELGSGFSLATHDLEIRGAGELLGESQSGHISKIGFGLYMELLERAVKSLQNGLDITFDPTNTSTEINLNISALIPDEYMPDVHLRLILYKRIANAKNEEQLRELKVEMIDRFGLLPEPITHLFAVTRLKLRAEPLGIHKIDAGPQGGKIEFGATPHIEPKKIIELVQKNPRHYQFAGSQAIRFTMASATPQERLQLVDGILSQLGA
jgi:transcription-repair coupling factor (superfamily II helicase)